MHCFHHLPDTYILFIGLYLILFYTLFKNKKANPHVLLQGLRHLRQMNYPAASCEVSKNNTSMPLMVSFRQSFSRNPGLMKRFWSPAQQIAGMTDNAAHD
jgi:hypothetical protein